MKSFKIAMFTVVALSANFASAAGKVECTKNRNKVALTKQPEETAAKPWLAVWDGARSKDSAAQPTAKATR